ncbi:MAG: GNAT family N-acetyltransferase [Promethearchaeota archaeon]
MPFQIETSEGKTVYIRNGEQQDREWIVDILTSSWASTKVVSRGVLHRADKLPGLIAIEGEDRVGLLTYHIIASDFEIVTLNALKIREHIGTNLVLRAEEIARSKQCNRIWVITTNDNKVALEFYQKLGFKIKAVHTDAIKRSRLLKPEIPLLGIDGVPIRDEIELEKKL